MSFPPVELSVPLRPGALRRLRAGEPVRVSGTVFAARDAALFRMFGAGGEGILWEGKGSVVYFAGPAAAPPGRAVGAMGPTSSCRMEPFLEGLLAGGVLGIIGKGPLSAEAAARLRSAGAVYLAAPGGAGALLSRKVLRAEIVAYPELGAEALRKLAVLDFPAVVAYDLCGGDAFSR